MTYTYDQLTARWPLLTMVQTTCQAMCGEDENPLGWLAKTFSWVKEDRLDMAEAELAKLTGAQIVQVFSIENGIVLPFAPIACDVLSTFNE